MRIALVHDQLNEFGGAERVLLAMSRMWPEAPIYTAYCKKGSPAEERFKGKDIRTSWMKYFYPLASPLRFLAPAVWNSFDLTDYDVILSSSSWYITKGFKQKGKAIEICYCHTPPRWLYGYPTAKRQTMLVRMYGTVIGFFMRQYDFTAAQRVKYFIANSKETEARIRKFYRRDSTVIYPPIDLPAIPKVTREDYYLFVSRPVGGKGLERAVAATKKLGVPLKIVGADGTHVTDTELAKLYAGAKAFLALATDEDFGMTPVEAMSFGTPVIAYAGGGYKESVIDGKTGVLFTGDIASAILKFEKISAQGGSASGRKWSDDCIVQAKKFSRQRFEKELRTFVEEKYRKQE